MPKSKSVKTKKHYNRRMKIHRHRPDVIHLVPDLAIAQGVLGPAIESGPGGPVLGDYVMGKMTGQSTAPLSDYIANVKDNYMSQIPSIVGWTVGGLLLKWVGKKTGLNRVGTKKVKVL